jgi:alcohol dehydrogenase (cytochrome c)
VPSERLLKAPGEPQNWLSYSGSYMSQRHSPLKQITIANAKNLELKWVFQAQSLQTFEATPLVVDGIMYVTQAPNDVVALDAKTGRLFWIYHYQLPQTLAVCCGLVNRGVIWWPSMPRAARRCGRPRLLKTQKATPSPSPRSS